PPPPEPVDAPPIPFAERMPVFGNECFDLEDAERKMCSDRALLSFVQSRAHYPALARENGVQGMVVIAFTVEKDGSVTDIEAVREVPAGCTESALKAVRAIQTEGKKFLPGRQGGLPVRVRFNLPVKFSLE
ncbi:MAG: energy transducer TonB, partial [Bacteroidota bacterium]